MTKERQSKPAMFTPRVPTVTLNNILDGFSTGIKETKHRHKSGGGLDWLYTLSLDLRDVLVPHAFMRAMF